MSELETPTTSSRNELLQLGRRERKQNKLKLKGVTETVAYDNMSQSQVFNPNPNPNSNYDSLRSGHSVFTTSSLGTLGTASGAFGTVNSAYLPSTSRSMGRARGLNVGSLRQLPIREEPSPSGSHEDSSANATEAENGDVNFTQSGNGAVSGAAASALSPLSPSANNSGTNVYSSAQPPNNSPFGNAPAASPYRNGQIAANGLPSPSDGKFVSDAFLTSENQRPEAVSEAGQLGVSWVLSPPAVRNVRIIAYAQTLLEDSLIERVCFLIRHQSKHPKTLIIPIGCAN